MERFKDGDGRSDRGRPAVPLAILEATGNLFIGALGSLIHVALVTTFRLSWEGAARMRDDRLHQHRAVFEAIRDGLPEPAHQRMADLLRDSIHDVREFLRHHDAASRLRDSLEGRRPRGDCPGRLASFETPPVADGQKDINISLYVLAGPAPRCYLPSLPIKDRIVMSASSKSKWPS